MIFPRSRRVPVHRSGGFIFLLVVLAILGIGGAFLLVGLGAGIARTEQRLGRAAASENSLNEVKQILVAYLVSPPNSVARPAASIRPGTLPTPDSMADGNYDGAEDAHCLSNGPNGLPWAGGSSTTRRCLGKFPWRAIPIDVGPGEPHDPVGRVPWLAVSSNLNFEDNCLRVLNSEVATLISPVTPSCPVAPPPYPQPTTLPHPWLTVFDQNGILLSDKVAAVLILPGPPIATETRTQARTALSPGNPADYLDNINLPLGCTTGCTLYDNAGLNNEFIMIPPGTNYPSDAPDTAKRNQPLRFNDVLVFLTIDEVMHYAEKRVASEMVKALKTFTTDTTTGFTKYPWLQPLSTSLVDSASLYPQPNTTFGAFPFMTHDVDAKYRSDFSWSVTGAIESTSWESTTGTGTTASVCHQIGTGPNRWVRNPLATTLYGATSYGGPFSTGTATPAAGTCKWLGGTKVDCEFTPSSVNKSFVTYSTAARCNSLTSPSPAVTLSVARKVWLTPIDSNCVPLATKTYTAASASTLHRWSWSCSNAPVGAIFEVRDTISGAGYSGLPRVAKMTGGGPTQAIAVTGMPYHPIMPAWFLDNRWYATAFAAWASGATQLPSAPSPNPCGSETSLKVGGATVNTGVVILAGRSLPGQSRPAASISNYLEGMNVTAGTTCALANAEASASSTRNDNILVVAP